MTRFALRFVAACLTAGLAWIVVEVGGGLVFLAFGVRLWRYNIAPLWSDITSPIVWLVAAIVIVPACFIFDRRVTDRLAPNQRLAAHLAFLMIAGPILEVIFNDLIFRRGFSMPLYTYTLFPTFGGSGSLLSPFYYATLIIHRPVSRRLLPVSDSVPASLPRNHTSMSITAKLRAYLLLVAFCSLAGVSALGAQSTATVSGRVTAAATGAPIEGITVSIPGVRTAVTDADGKYIMRGLVAGTDSVTFRWIGFAPRTVSFALAAGATKSIDVALEQAAVSLMQVRVTGVSRQPERVVEAPAAVSVVAPGRVADVAPTGELPMLFADLPGVRVEQDGITSFAVNSRGFNNVGGRRLLVLIDGRDASVPILNNQSWVYDYVLDPATQMEFVRGPGSALYGADAFSGVLAITTPAVRESHATELDISGGAPGMYRATARTGWLSSDDRWGARLSVGYESTDTFDKSRTNIGDLANEYATAGIAPGSVTIPAPGFEPVPLAGQTKAGAFGTPGPSSGPRDPTNTEHASARLDYYLDDGSALTAEGGWSRRINDIGENSVGRGQGVYDMDPWARIGWTSDRFALMAYTTNDNSESEALYSGGKVQANSTTNQIEGQVNQWFADNRGRFVFGGSLRSVAVNTHGTLIAPSDDNRTDNYYGIFGEVEYKLTSRLKAVVAGRVDEGALHEAQVSPKFALVYSPNDHESWRVGVNRGYLTPSTLERLINSPAGPPLDLSLLEQGLRASPLGPALAGVPVGTLFTNSSAVPLLAIGNPNLNASQVNGFEGGYKGELGRLTLTVDAYYSDLSNFVSGLLPGASTQFGSWTAPSAVPAAAAVAVESAVQAALGAGLTRLSNGNTAFVLTSGNFGKAQEYGLEIGAGFQATRSLRWDANYSYYGFHINQASFFAGDTIQPNTPKHTVNGSGTWSSGRWRVRGGVRWNDAYHWQQGLWNGMVPSVLAFDFNGSVELNRSTTLSLSALNVFDERRIEVYGGSVIGRRVVAGMAWRP